MITYIIYRDDCEHGPYTLGQLREFVEAGEVTPDCPVRFSTDADWQTVGNILSSFDGPPIYPQPAHLQMVCPHCHQRGGVKTRRITRKAGIDGDKAAAALLTDGWSLLATGLSREEQVTEAKCSLCYSTWHF